MRARLLALVLGTSCCLCLGPFRGAEAKPKKKAEGKMSKNGLPQVEARLVGRRPGRPPMNRLDLEVVLRNPRSEPRWFVLPKGLPKDGAGGGVDAVEARAYGGGKGRAVVGEFMGTGGFQGVLVPAGGEVRLRHFPLTYWGQPPDPLEFDAVVASQITVGGEPASAWFAQDPTSDAHVDATDAEGKVLVSRKAPDNKEAPVSLTEESRVKLSISLKGS